jgi:1-acyl-sn-glycerol-3-phosphate acyltransferase
VILAANHSSNLDPLFLGLASPRELFFIAKEGLFEVSRSFTWLLEKFNAIPLRRGGVDLSALRKAAELLRKGQTVVLFPEGTRSKLGKFLGFKAGVGFLAIRNRIPVIPAYIYGVDNSFLSFIFDSDIRRPTDMERRAGRFKNYLLHRRRIGVEFGRPIEPRDYRAEKADYLQFTAQVNEAILGLAESLKRR